MIPHYKSERDNVSPEQLADLKAAASEILKRNEALLVDDIEAGRLLEVDFEDGEQDIDER